MKPVASEEIVVEALHRRLPVSAGVEAARIAERGERRDDAHWLSSRPWWV